MSNVLIGVIGVVLAIGLALAGALYLGDQFSKAANDAEAARYLAEGAQIAQAYELYGVNEGAYPNGATSDQKIDQLHASKYLKSKPLGGTPTGSNSEAWYIDETTGAALTLLGEDDGSRRVCVAARTKMGFTDPIKQCSDSSIHVNDPCCIGS